MALVTHRSPLDSGWSWVVLGSAFLANFFTVGFSYAIGVYYSEFLHVFEESKGLTAWIAGLHYGTLCGVGPLSSALIHHLGNRVTMFIGGIIASSGLFICAFANDIYTVIIAFGVVNGMGSGIVYAAGIVIMGTYFEKYRPLAFGLGLAGGGIANISFPWITFSLIDEYTWRGALMITSGLMLNLCVGAMLIFPQRTTTDKNANVEDLVYVLTDEELNGIKQSSQTTRDKDECHDTDAKNNCSSFITMTIEIIRRPAVLIMFTSTFFFLAGTAVVYCHLLVYAEYQGVSRNMGSLMISCLGICSFAGRLGLSTMSQQPCTDTVLLYIVAILITGLSTLGMAFWNSVAGLFICSCIFGFFCASFGPTCCETLFIIVGQKHFNISYGLEMLLMGLGWTVGAPAAGFMYDLTQYYGNSFYLGGAMTIFGSLIMIPAKYSLKKEHVRNLDETQMNGFERGTEANC